MTKSSGTILDGESRPEGQGTGTVPRTQSMGRLFVLDLSGGRVFSMNPDGADSKTLVTGCRMPDGIALDLEKGHFYWTDMGVPNRNDGKIERADLDGGNRRTIVPEGATFTPKQIHLDSQNRKLYWSDREGMRVMRSNLDGSHIETLVDASQGDTRPGADALKWCVGITVDADRGHIYWTQKGPDNGERGRIFRANLEIPAGQNAANRRDITVLFDRLPEPIDLELDLKNRHLYWTDRGDPPRGNTVNRTSIDGQLTQDIVLSNLMEGIGIALDVPGDRMFVTDLAGSVYSAKLNGPQKRVLAYAQGNLAGVAYAEITSKEK
jgi:sugar lactone lactonase YvrE